MERDRKGMEKLFFPESIIVVGVSDGPANLGAEIIRNLNRFSFAGRVYGLGREAMELEGRRVYQDIGACPEIPDLAVLLVPAPAVPAALDACGRKGVRSVVIESGGFSEFGREREALEHQIGRIARDKGMTCMGPNCIGLINMENGLCLPFVPFSRTEVVRGRNSFVSQSGGLIHELVRRCAAEHVGLSKLASIGNKLMLDENAFLQFLAGDRDTGAIGIYLEAVSDGRRLMDLAAATEKPVIVLKGNTSPAAREIASFHTAALLGDDGVARAAMTQAGIHRVTSLTAMVECFKVFSLPPVRGPNLMVMSRSGGQSVVLADEAYRHGFALPDLPPAFFDRIKAEAKAGVIRNTNPIDLGDVFNDLFYLEVVEAALKEPTVDGVVFFYDYPFDSTTVFEMKKGIEALCRTYDKPVVFCVVPDKAHWFSLTDHTSFPIFVEPERAFEALRQSLAHFRKKHPAGRTHRAAPGKGPSRPPSGGPPKIAGAAETLSLMEAYGVPLARGELAPDLAGVTGAARSIGYPVVLKQAAPFILHKTEAGAVRLSLGSDEEVGEAVRAMKADLYLVQEMARPGVETIVGAKRDPEFGPVVVFGLGGLFVEVLKDAAVRVAPLDEAGAGEMIREIRGAPLLAGARGGAPSDTAALAKVLVAVSRLLVDHPEVMSIDINPLRVFAQGEGCLALDVKLEKAEPTGGRT